MPTAAKLAAAVAFALVALLTAQLFIPYLPEGMQLGWFRPITAAIGFVVGAATAQAERQPDGGGEAPLGQSVPCLAEEQRQPIGFLMAAHAEEAIAYEPPDDASG